MNWRDVVPAVVGIILLAGTFVIAWKPTYRMMERVVRWALVPETDETRKPTQDKDSDRR